MAKEFLKYNDVTNEDEKQSLLISEINSAIDIAKTPASSDKDWIGRQGHCFGESEIAAPVIIDNDYSPDMLNIEVLFSELNYGADSKVVNPSLTYHHLIQCYGNWFLSYTGNWITPVILRHTVNCKVFNESNVLQSTVKVAQDYIIDDGLGTRHNAYWYGGYAGINRNLQFFKVVLLPPEWSVKFELNVVGLTATGLSLTLDGYMEFIEKEKWSI